ncbi:MAG TPA: protein kinase [Pirellulaceae bacterium]|jgi:hypothetical protein|nr:protein kinase [Pirellulaceae bacterium]
MDFKSKEGAAIDRTEVQSPADLSDARARSVERAQPPGRVPGYTMVRFLGAGAYGEVWEARNNNTQRRVAIKFFTRGDLDFSALGQEVDKLLKLANDRYVVQVLEVGWDADPPYYVMDFLEFGSLDDLLRQKGTLTAAEALEQFREIAVALMHLHGRGVLHCDLKPANVLLDEDHHPRLADFGQARLHNEQSPALGTLFFMAPEQADLKAIPDARWDVFALGAIFYVLVTGSPPFRTERTLSEIDSAGSLPARLRAYRQAIAQSPPPQEHRQVDGVDSALATIIDQCLAVDPRKRLASAQSVLESLRLRELNRQRRPLLALGLFGPAILLGTLAFFAWVGYREATSRSHEAIVQRAQESNRFAASYIAANVARGLDEYLLAIENAAVDSPLIQGLKSVQEDPGFAELLVAARDPAISPEEAKEIQARIIAYPGRQEFQRYIESWGEDPSRPPAASWITIDPHGTHVADWFAAEDSINVVGRNYAYRTYFHGGDRDLPDDARPACGIGPGETYLSPVFYSTADGSWKIMITRRVMDGEQFLGLVGLSVEMGGFPLALNRTTKQPAAEALPPQFATLLGERSSNEDFAVLQHPTLKRIFEREGRLPLAIREANLSFTSSTIDELKRESVQPHTDPIAKVAAQVDLDPEEAAALQGEWIGGVADVTIDRENGSGREKQSKVVDKSGLVVLVQEKVSHISEPIGDLTSELNAQARNAGIFVVLVILAMWLYVVRMNRDVRRSLVSTLRGNRPGGSVGAATPMAETPASGVPTGRATENK